MELIYKFFEQLSTSLLIFKNILHSFFYLLCSEMGFNKSICKLRWTNWIFRGREYHVNVPLVRVSPNFFTNTDSISWLVRLLPLTLIVTNITWSQRNDVSSYLKISYIRSSSELVAKQQLVSMVAKSICQCNSFDHVRNSRNIFNLLILFLDLFLQG